MNGRRSVLFVLVACIGMATSSTAFGGISEFGQNWSGHTFHTWQWGQWGISAGSSDNSIEIVGGVPEGDLVFHTGTSGMGGTFLKTYDGDPLPGGGSDGSATTNAQSAFMNQYNMDWYRIDFVDALDSLGNRPDFRAVQYGPYSSTSTTNPVGYKPGLAFGQPGLYNSSVAPGASRVNERMTNQDILSTDSYGDPNYGTDSGSWDDPSDNEWDTGESFYSWYGKSIGLGLAGLSSSRRSTGLLTTSGSMIPNDPNAPFGGMASPFNDPNDPNSGSSGVYVHRNVDDPTLGEFTSYIVGRLADGTYEWTVIKREYNAGTGQVEIESTHTMQNKVFAGSSQLVTYENDTWGLETMDLQLSGVGIGSAKDFTFLRYQVGSQYKQQFLQGDINGDNSVDIGDLALAGAQWGTAGTLTNNADIAGDPDSSGLWASLYGSTLIGNTNAIPQVGDGSVDIGDLALVGANWGGTPQYNSGGGEEGGGGSSSVPVPSAALLAVAGLGALGMRRRRT